MSRMFLFVVLVVSARFPGRLGEGRVSSTQRNSHLLQSDRTYSKTQPWRDVTCRLGSKPRTFIAHTLIVAAS
jgi:hypothetical protein